MKKTASVPESDYPALIILSAIAQILTQKRVNLWGTGVLGKEDYGNAETRRGRPPQFDKRIEHARIQVEGATGCLEKAKGNQSQMKAMIEKISDSYHPVDIETGGPKDAQEVSNSLSECFLQIETVASEAALSEPSSKRILKAKKVTPDMVATIAFLM